MATIYKVLFKEVGVYKVIFNYPIVVFMIVVILIIISTLIIASLLANKIKKISVYSLIKD